ncbi:unnamed protein product [Effrenium voratum]|nr:unnamed protein product [Effrenium voratum]
MAERGPAASCLLLVCGLPGCGKSTFCKELVARGGEESWQGTSRWIHFCYDEVERTLRTDESQFDPETWQAARAKISGDVAALLDNSDGRIVIVLDDNMYYRSMRKRWYHLCRDRGCAYHQVFLQAPLDVCLERNQRRDLVARVPKFSIEHMAEAFEWPARGGTWEAQDAVSLLIDEAETCMQIQCIRDWHSFWKPVPAEEGPAEEVQSESHQCDVALRKVVTRALAEVPKELGPLKSTLAKRWGAKKAELAAKPRGAPGECGGVLRALRCSQR